MKTTLQFILLFFLSFSLAAQSTVKLSIDHLLDAEKFEYDVDSKNDLGNDFNFKRLEYYISTFSITHDGGQVTNIDGLYFLISMNNPKSLTDIDLGEYDIQNVESVNFYLGIDEEANHADPSLWPTDHALAPKFPSMHWGWASGYRFIALEGLSGPSVDQDLQFHCIGDEFYEEMRFPVTSIEGSTYTVEIDANYENILSGIDISSGLILHGNLSHIKTLATNLKTKVFTSAQVTSTDDNDVVNAFEVFPNPTHTGLVTLNIDVTSDNNIIQVYDTFGSMIQRHSSKVKNINLGVSGIYFISLTDDKGNPLATRKVIVQ